MNYKRFIKNQNVRFKILSFLSFVPDNIMLSMQYYLKMHERLHLRKPIRFGEWIQWYKVNHRDKLMHKCVDKYDVRAYVAGKGLADILIPCYGVYSTPEEIDLSSLPDKFVIKTTDGGGGQNIIICNDKNVLNYDEMIRLLTQWKNKKDINAGREWAYTGIKESRIIIEKLLENSSGADRDLPDYKILCFNGKPRYIFYDCDRFIEHRRNTYDTNWNRINVDTDCLQKDAIIPKPESFDKMLEIAGTLSQDFPFVRVDLYNIQGKIFFGELTFYPCSGYIPFKPDSFSIELGNLFREAVESFHKV